MGCSRTRTAQIWPRCRWRTVQHADVDSCRATNLLGKLGEALPFVQKGGKQVKLRRLSVRRNKSTNRLVSDSSLPGQFTCQNGRLGRCVLYAPWVSSKSHSWGPVRSTHPHIARGSFPPVFLRGLVSFFGSISKLGLVFLLYLVRYVNPREEGTKYERLFVLRDQ